jgi:hypothetical protein
MEHNTMNSQLVKEQWHDFYQYAQCRDIIFYYGGYFSQSIIAAMADAVKLRVEHVGAASMTRRKLFSSFIEMSQNIIHYSADAVTRNDEHPVNMRHGMFFISTRDERYYLHCANPVHHEVAQGLREKLSHLRTLTIEEIKSEYKQMLRSEAPENSKGAGLGFLTVARDASEPLEFDFSPEDENGNMMFYLKVTI